MEFNWLVILGAAVIPTVTGFIWYNPNVLGKAWMSASGMTEEKMKGANMAVIFIVSFILSFLLAFSLLPMTIHQMGVMSLTGGDPELMTTGAAAAMFEEYGTAFRTFKHGALHGAIGGLFIALPILGTNALFERKGFKYIAVNVGYWVVTMTLMGGVICQWV